MDFLTSMKISSSGMNAQKKRIGAINSNLANVHTTQTAEGGPYRRKITVFGSEPARESFSEILEGEIDAKAQEVHVTDIVSSNEPPRLEYRPSHPDANENGYVAFPNINPIVETADMLNARNSYEANLNAFNTTKQMAMKALEIGR